MSSHYTDEKHPDVVYEVIPVVEAVEVKQPRPLWRRFLRILLTMTAISMVWSTFAPVVHHKCHRMRHHHKQTPPTDIDFSPVADRPLAHYTFPADLDHFSITQESFGGSLTRTEVIGKVVVATCSKAENISAHFKFDATDDNLLEKIEVSPSKHGLTFKLDPFSLVKQTVNATVYVVLPKKDDYELKQLAVETIQLDVVLSKSFTTPINATYVSTVSGDVTSYGSGDQLLDINNLKVVTTSGHILGDFPIAHALALETTSGDITAKVASEKRPEHIGWFKTETVSGKTEVAFDGILNPRPLYSKHTSVSGDVNIDYPEDWQGGFKIETTSGAIDVVGKGTKIVKKEKGLTKKLWEVVKGEGKSKGYIGTVNGAINVVLGDKE